MTFIFWSLVYGISYAFLCVLAFCATPVSLYEQTSYTLPCKCGYDVSIRKRLSAYVDSYPSKILSSRNPLIPYTLWILTPAFLAALWSIHFVKKRHKGKCLVLILETFAPRK